LPLDSRTPHDAFAPSRRILVPPKRISSPASFSQPLADSFSTDRAALAKNGFFFFVFFRVSCSQSPRMSASCLEAGFRGLKRVDPTYAYPLSIFCGVRANFYSRAPSRRRFSGLRFFVSFLYDLCSVSQGPCVLFLTPCYSTHFFRVIFGIPSGRTFCRLDFFSFPSSASLP